MERRWFCGAHAELGTGPNHMGFVGWVHLVPSGRLVKMAYSKPSMKY